jgi:TonB family protein
MKQLFFSCIHQTIFLTLVIVSSVAQADFELGMKYYNQSNFEKAHREFNQAAKFGDVSAQFNLGVMYFRGEFVAKDPIQAYAWLALAAQDPDYKEQGLHLQIYKTFSDEQKKIADLAYQEIFKQFNQAAIEESLKPTLVNASTLSRKVRVLKQTNPNYPQTMLRDEKSGYVDILLTIAKDGTTRDHVVYFSTNKAFTQPTLDAIRKWQYKPAIIDGKPVEVQGYKIRFSFMLGDMKYDDSKINMALDAFKEKALTGKASDQFLYGFFLDILPTYTEFKPKLDDGENANKWYLLAAQNGDIVSSYFLGQNILNGNMCMPDPNKGMAWLLKAASKNMVNAQYLLAAELLSGTRLLKNDDQGMYWLNKAANGNSISNYQAKLRLAWILSTHPSKDKRDGALALSHLQTIDKNYQDKQTYYRTAAAVYAENGDFELAQQWQEKALSDAKSLEFSLDALQSHLELYKGKQALRENP